MKCPNTLITYKNKQNELIEAGLCHTIPDIDETIKQFYNNSEKILISKSICGGNLVFNLKLQCDDYLPEGYNCVCVK